MKRTMFAVVSLLFLFYFLIPSVSALGIAPALISLDFVPNYENEFEGIVTNSDGGTRGFDIYFDGDLVEYMTLLTPDYIVLGDQESHYYKFRLKLPDELEKPGKHTTIIWAAQHTDPAKPGTVAARIRVGTTLVVRVPYPGKYAEIDLNIINANVNETVLFDIGVHNLGKENITSARGEIELMDKENRTIVILQTDPKFIETTKTEILQATWFSDVAADLYKARVKVFYDGEIAEMERIFNIGAPLIKIINITADTITNGTIGKVLTKIQSFWGMKIENVYIEMSFMDKDGKGVGSDKSQNFNIPAFGTLTIINYWDTTNGVPLGDYRGLATLHYLDKNDTAEFDLEVVGKPGIFIGNEILIIIAVVAVVIIIVFLLFYYKKKEKYKQKRLG